MEEQTRTRGSSAVQGSEEENVWSEENEIYYYSNFELFQRHSDANEFYQYSLFVEEVSKELGEEWRVEAQVLCDSLYNSKEVFLNLLSLWLKHHGPKLQGSNSPTFQSSFVQEFVDQIRLDLQDPNIKINLTSAKALCMGFFLTANDVWTQMFQSPEKPQPPKNILFQSVTETIERSFRPIMVVRQRIGRMFGKKKVKTNETVMEEEQPYKNSTGASEMMFENCFHEFRKNLDLEREVQRKMSEFSIDDHEEPFTNNREQEMNKYVLKEPFKESDAPVENNIISSMYRYVTEFLNRKHSWQVANKFVTNILEMSNTNAKEGTKIKILCPAQDFYHKLILVWLSFKEGNSVKVEFEVYLTKVKSTFGQNWQDKYAIPTKYFYERITQNWDAMQAEAGYKKLEDKEIMGVLIRRIRLGMAADWDKKIRISKKHKKQEQIIRG